MTSVRATVRQWCLGLGCAALLVIASLPWVYSGERDRNSFALVRSADRLDLTDGLVHRAAQLGWLLMPAMVGIVVIAVALHRRSLAALGGLYVGGSSIAMALLVERSSLDRSTWPVAAVAVGLGVVVIALVELRAKKGSDVSTKPVVGDVSAP